MKKAIALVLAILLVILSGCTRLNSNTGSIEIEDCSFLQKDGSHIVLENNNLIQKYRARYGLGTCHTLSGKQTVVLFFMDDSESSWSKQEVIKYTNEIIVPALEFLEKEAEKWEVELSFEIKRYSSPLSEKINMVYDGTVIKDLDIAGSTKDLPKQTANILKFNTELEMLAAFIDEYQNESIIPLMLINKDGTAYARSQLSEQIVNHLEHAVLFADSLGSINGLWKYTKRRRATTAHEILHLFGAEDYYDTYARRKLAEKYYINDIMLLDSYNLSDLSVSEATAYYVGWTNKTPTVCYDKKWHE